MKKATVAITGVLVVGAVLLLIIDRSVQRNLNGEEQTPAIGAAIDGARISRDSDTNAKAALSLYDANGFDANGFDADGKRIWPGHLSFDWNTYDPSWIDFNTHEGRGSMGHLTGLALAELEDKPMPLAMGRKIAEHKKWMFDKEPSWHDVASKERAAYKLCELLDWFPNVREDPVIQQIAAELEPIGREVVEKGGMEWIERERRNGQINYCVAENNRTFAEGQLPFSRERWSQFSEKSKAGYINRCRENGWDAALDRMADHERWFQAEVKAGRLPPPPPDRRDEIQ